MLEGLNVQHEAILAAAAELRDLVDHDVPDEAGIATARARIARISATRTRLLDHVIYPALLAYLGLEDAAIVRRLRDSRLQGMAHSAHGIGTWDSRRIAQEWPEYQRLFAAVLAGLRSRIAAEQAVLIPLIKKVRLCAPQPVAVIERALHGLNEPSDAYREDAQSFA